MTILVTGGAGFIGSNFVIDWLASSRETVINLDKLTYAGNPANLASLAGAPEHQFVRGDIGDRELMRNLLARHRPRAIVNFAAESHVDRSIHGPAEFVQTNVVGTFSLLDEVRAWWQSAQRQRILVSSSLPPLVSGTMWSGTVAWRTMPLAAQSRQSGSACTRRNR